MSYPSFEEILDHHAHEEWLNSWLRQDGEHPAFVKEARRLASRHTVPASVYLGKCCGMRYDAEDWKPYFLEGIAPKSLLCTPIWCYRPWQIDHWCRPETIWVRFIEGIMYIVLFGVLVPVLIPITIFLPGELGLPCVARIQRCSENNRCCNCFTQVISGVLVCVCCPAVCGSLSIACLTPLGLGVINAGRCVEHEVEWAATKLKARTQHSMHATQIQSTLDMLGENSALKDKLSSSIIGWDPESNSLRVINAPKKFLRLHLGEDFPKFTVQTDTIIEVPKYPGQIAPGFCALRDLAIVREYISNLPDDESEGGEEEIDHQSEDAADTTSRNSMGVKSGRVSGDNARFTIDLPDDLHVKGNAVISKVTIRTFGERMKFDGDLILRLDNPTPFTLPADMQVKGQLNCIINDSLVGLPANIETIGSIYLVACTQIEYLPPNLKKINGSLVLAGCTNLKELPAGLTIRDNLILINCTALEALPENLTVGDTLNAEGCSSLTYIPPSIQLIRTREINLAGCTSLESVPIESIARSPKRPLAVNIADTNLPDDLIQQLRSIKGVLVLFNRLELSSLEDVAREFGVNAEELRAHIDKAYVWGVLQFLSMLLQSKEYVTEEYRPALRERVKEVLDIIINDPVSREEIIIRMLDAVDACADKPIWALGQMQVVVAIAHARGNREKLRTLGRRIMRLNIVHKHVEAYINSMDRGVDDVSSYLRFEIELRDVLDLPVSSKAMIFPHSVSISKEKINAAREEALAVTEEQFEEWLSTWPEWQRQNRMDAIVPYMSLRLNPELLQDMSVDSDDLVDLQGEPIRDPVFLLPNHTDVWSYNDLCERWVSSGLGFANEPLTQEDFLSNTRRLLDVAPDLSETPKRASLGRRKSERRSLASSVASSLPGSSGVQEIYKRLSQRSAGSISTSLSSNAPTPEEPFKR